MGLRRSRRERLPFRKLREVLELLGLLRVATHVLLTMRDKNLNIS
jgi:hypothetical protein